MGRCTAYRCAGRESLCRPASVSADWPDWLEIEHDGVDGASAGGAFAAGGEKAGVGVGVDAGGEDMAVRDTGPEQCQADGFPEVNVQAALHGAGYPGPTVGDNRSVGGVCSGESGFRKACVEEGPYDFWPDLEAVMTYAGTDYRQDVGGAGAELPGHCGQGLRRDFQYRTLPPGMYCGYCPTDRIIHEHRYAVGSPGTDGNSRHVGYQRIKAFEVFPRESRRADNGHPVPVHLMCLYHGHRKHGVPERGECRHVRADAVAQEAGQAVGLYAADIHADVVKLC